MASPSATCELWINGARVACELGDLASGEPTVLDDLSIGWGRDDLWQQPDPGSITFRLHDQRTAARPLEDIVHAGARLEVWAEAPNPTPTTYTYMNQGFQDGGTVGQPMQADRWKLWPLSGTSPSASVYIVDASLAPPGSGTRSGYLYLNNQQAAFEFPPQPWRTRWNLLRPMAPGEVWNYSIMTRAKAGSTLTLRFKPRTSSNPDDDPILVVGLEVGPGVQQRQIAQDGTWITSTGTVTNQTSRFVYPTFHITTPANSYDATTVMPTVDGLILTAPPQTEQRLLVFAGRVSDVVVEPSARGTISLSVSGVGAATEAQNVSVGDTPWSAGTIPARLNNVMAAIPPPLDTQLSLVLSPFMGLNPAVGSVRGRDVDKQPALDLIRDYVDDAFAVAWPVSTPVERNQIWVELLNERLGSSWAGPQATLSACDLPKSAFQVRQATAEVITVVDVKWLVFDADNELVPATVTVIDEDAADKYGLQRLAIDTELGTEAGATNLANAAMNWARAGMWAVDGIEFDSAAQDDPDGSLQRFLLLILSSARRPGAKVTITDLPEWVPVSVASGFIEGGTVQYVGGRWRFDLTTSAAAAG